MKFEHQLAILLHDPKKLYFRLHLEHFPNKSGLIDFHQPNETKSHKTQLRIIKRTDILRFKIVLAGSIRINMDHISS